MFRFFFKCLFVACLLFIGVILGMQEANEGLKKMKGYDDPRFGDVFSVEEGHGENYEATVFGQSVVSHDPDGKGTGLKETRGFDFFSEMGKKASKAVSDFVSYLLSFLE
ncbi:YqxA family protein [Caldibacillus debilis]|uniref:YqxA family protein n=1 Tax=Caldibacillus debilis TaxID=301148 RepID=UPI00037EB759|nr:YqxA family protein [Caldibacillus debilis]